MPNHPDTYDYALALATTGQYTEALTALDSGVQVNQPTTTAFIQISPLATPSPAFATKRASFPPEKRGSTGVA
ncbi:MAG: hypothetical protein R3E79_08405 [Caldilineaceae bacterium]